MYLVYNFLKLILEPYSLLLLLCGQKEQEHKMEQEGSRLNLNVELLYFQYCLSPPPHHPSAFTASE